MKKLVLYLVLVLLLGFVSGCKLDDESELNNAWVSFGLVHEDSVSKDVTIELDNGALLFPESNSGWLSNVDNNQRVWTNFTIIGDKKNAENKEQYYVHINSLRKILYKGILDITPAMEDSIGNDPIHVSDYWIRKNMLTFELKYKGGSKIHYLNLVKPANSPANTTEPVVLELRHNNNDDEENVTLSAFVTFDLSSLKVQGKDSVEFKIVSKDFNDEEFAFTRYYKY